MKKEKKKKVNIHLSYIYTASVSGENIVSEWSKVQIRCAVAIKAGASRVKFYDGYETMCARGDSDRDLSPSSATREMDELLITRRVTHPRPRLQSK